jgi:2-haloacid dehalogenase
MDRPALITFDIFGTVVDWRRGLAEALAPLGRTLDGDAFDRVIDHQGQDEQRAPFRRYREITARSLEAVLGVDAAAADRVGAAVGRWPLYPDSAAGLARLMERAPCAATTNSDRAHGEDVQAQLGFRLSAWISAEELGRYKPDPVVWEETARRLGVRFGRAWWHVSAYADYDLEVARALGLTTVLIPRPHHRPGPADVTAPDLLALAAMLPT